MISSENRNKLSSLLSNLVRKESYDIDIEFNARSTFPIYIPSKGRHDISTTYIKLLEDKLDFKMVVEPQDYDSYCVTFGSERVIKLPDNNRGLGYSRKCIKEYSKNRGELYHWQLDDDILSFVEKTSGKKVKCNASVVLGNIEKWCCKHSNIAIAAPIQTTWSFDGKVPKNSVNINKVCASAVLVNNAVEAIWPEGLWEDLDYCMQVLKKGWVTVRFETLLVNLPPYMKNKGGCTDSYKKEGQRKIDAENFNARWGGIFKVKEKDGWTTIAPSNIWKTFKQRPKLIEKL